LQNYAGIIGMEAAVEYLDAIGMDEIRAHEISLNRRLTKALIDVPGVELVGPTDPNRRGGIFSFNLKGLSPHDVAMILDNSRNIMIRSGMHCCHAYFRARGMEGCARASLYLYNTEHEVDIFSEAVAGLSARFDRSRAR
jgi:cysteine desulfurase/selenocysteine lyase